MCSWTVGVGAQWPRAGEIDIYEGWNENAISKPALHVGPASEIGQCVLDGANQTSPLSTATNCDNAFTNPPSQWPSQGCVTEETHDGIWASPVGGTRIVYLAFAFRFSC